MKQQYDTQQNLIALYLHPPNLAVFCHTHKCAIVYFDDLPAGHVGDSQKIEQQQKR